MRLLFIYFMLAFLITNTVKAQVSSTIHWPVFLQRNDLVYDTLTTQWEDGVFTGNGLIGTMLYLKDSSSIRLDMGRTDVFDHRNEPALSPLFTRSRLPIGHFLLQPVGKIIKNTARIHLWDAEAKGIIVTDKGTIAWRLVALAQTNVIVFETSATGSENTFAWSFVPEESISPRMDKRWTWVDKPGNFFPNPAPEITNNNGVNICRQPMQAGGEYCTVWKTAGTQNKKVVFISINYNPSGPAVAQAVKTVNAAGKKTVASLIAPHRQYWHGYYPQSFLSIPDSRMESFYWVQMYKIASATGTGKPPLDLMGPWFMYTPWPAYWYNLNIQLTYSPLYTANRLGIAQGLIKMVDDNKENLRQNVPAQYQYNALALGRAGTMDMVSPVKVFPERDTTAGPAQLEMGNLTWLLYYYWQHYRFTMNENIKRKLVPLLKGSINYYLDVMSKGDDGKWHLPYTTSPEYPGGITRDCNYDLSLFKWGCKTLLELSPKDSLAPVWEDVVTHLANYPQDNTGLKIGSDVAFNTSHRHYSHLLMIYPLHTINWEQPENRALIKKSLEHWHSFKNALQGYSYTGGAAIYASMGQGDKAGNYLNQLFDRYLKPNTMYLESGPVIETPLAAAESIHTLLLQSWGGKIRIFPAVPASWQDAAFENLRTEGAFLVSAVRKNAVTQWVKVKSLAGGTCIINPAMQGIIKTKGAKVMLQKTDDGTYQFKLKKGETVVLYTNESALAVNAAAVPQNGKINYWGRKVL